MQWQDRWHDVPRRLLTIAVGVPLLWSFWKVHPIARHVFFVGLHVVLCIEWGYLAQWYTSSSNSGLGVIFPLVSTLLVVMSTTGGNNDFGLQNALFLALLPMALAVVVVWTVVFHYHTADGSTGVHRELALYRDLCLLACGLTWLTTTGRSWVQLTTSGDVGFVHTVSLLLTVWNADTGALIAGRLFAARNGGVIRYVLDAVSPQKSTAGLVGGVLGGTLTYVCLPWFWSCLHHYGLHTIDAAAEQTKQEHVLSYFQALVHRTGQESISSINSFSSGSVWMTGLFLSLVSLLGDLVESAFKRITHVKDTGTWLPAHGGALDRFDSSLLVVGWLQYAWVVVVASNRHSD
jgi:CDP-diglyceride synthetase